MGLPANCYRPGRQVRIIGAAVSYVTLTVLSAAAATAATAPASAASVTSQRGFLNSVSATSAANAWAVGFTVSSGTQQATILHWNGTRWAHLPSPQPSGATGTVLSGVSAVSASDAWAVGALYLPGGSTESLVLRWSGTRWKRVAAPGNGFAEVSADSAADAWAVGGPAPAVHWNGTSWKQVSIPVLTSEDSLTGVSAQSPRNVWIAGYTFHNNGTGEVVPLTLHWNGTRWRRVPAPNPGGTSGGVLEAIATAGSRAWAVGDYGPVTSQSPFRSLALEWNRRAWKRIPTPSPGESGCILFGVSARSRSGAWAVGTCDGTLALHWNGTRWRQVATPTPSGGGQLNSVSTISRRDAWAVGNGEASGGTMLIEHWNGSTWTRF